MNRRKPFNEYDVCGDVTKIFLYNKDGKIFESIIDTKNLNRLIELNKHWHLQWNAFIRAYYVMTNFYLGIEDGKKKSKTLKLHDFLLNKREFDPIIDHINRDTLDNREINLRPAGIDENAMNRKGPNKNNKSGYRNV
jgi:hypothetical protein